MTSRLIPKDEKEKVGEGPWRYLTVQIAELSVCLHRRRPVLSGTLAIELHDPSVLSSGEDPLRTLCRFIYRIRSKAVIGREAIAICPSPA
jgi:hypothetical protein